MQIKKCLVAQNIDIQYLTSLCKLNIINQFDFTKSRTILKHISFISLSKDQL